MSRRRPPPALLRLHSPPKTTPIIIPVCDSSASPAAEHPPLRSSRNPKRLSLPLPPHHPHPPSDPPHSPPHPSPQRSRRLSVASLPTTTLRHRKEEEPSPTLPYLNGPVQIIPGIWLGSEDNARDWKGLIERGVRSILNVAKEVVSPFDSVKPVRPFSSTPNLLHPAHDLSPTCYPAHLPSGRPTMHYLKLDWSHGQQDLVREGFPAAMAFADAALERGDGVLIHCQCGISRSATMVIALVMRAAAHRSPSVPPDIWSLKGMQGAYAYVKEKSQWIGPNMSLIYQLLEYERALQSEIASNPSSERSSILEEEEEWGRQRRMLDEMPSDHDDDQDDNEQESVEVMREARALDKAMEDRIIARKSSGSSISSSSGIGMGPAWRNRYGGRKRTGSNATCASILSEDLVEEDEEPALLGVGGGFDDRSIQHRSPTISDSTSPESIDDGSEPNALWTSTPCTAPNPPPSAPVWRTSFTVALPPITAVKALSSSSPKPNRKHRSTSMDILPSVPDSPIAGTVDSTHAPRLPRPRTLSRKPAPPPLRFRKTQKLPPGSPSNRTPSQTLFVFPPSPTPTTRTPSTMTLTSNLNFTTPFPTSPTPRVSTFRSHGRTKSFIDLSVPPTPTIACSRVDARGWIGPDIGSVN